MANSELIIIRGLPGSGKSTRAKSEYPDYLHYEPDHLFCDTAGRYRFDAQIWDKAVEWVLIMTDFALARGENVVVSDVFAKKESFKRFVEIAEAHGSVVKVIVTDGQYENTHRIPVTILSAMRDSFEK
jgi:predicted kinase